MLRLGGKTNQVRDILVVLQAPWSDQLSEKSSLMSLGVIAVFGVLRCVLSVGMALKWCHGVQ